MRWSRARSARPRRWSACTARSAAAGTRPTLRRSRSAERLHNRLNRLGILKSTFDVNKHIEPKHILKVMQDKPELFSDLPPILADAALKAGYVFKP